MSRLDPLPTAAAKPADRVAYLDNARYWYRQARRTEFAGSLEDEWTAIAAELLRPA